MSARLAVVLGTRAGSTASPYGDGTASTRIVRAIHELLLQVQEEDIA